MSIFVWPLCGQTLILTLSHQRAEVISIQVVPRLFLSVAGIGSSNCDSQQRLCSFEKGCLIRAKAKNLNSFSEQKISTLKREHSGQ